MLDLWKEMQKVNHAPIRRVICFAAALALKQNQPQVALDFISHVSNQGFYLIRSIKVRKSDNAAAQNFLRLT